jgi:hypothetical protein
MAPEQRAELTSLRLSSIELELLKAAATQTGLSQSDVLRQALRAYCVKLGLDVAKPQKPTKAAASRGRAEIVPRQPIVGRAPLAERNPFVPRSPFKPKK